MVSNICSLGGTDCLYWPNYFGLKRGTKASNLEKFAKCAQIWSSVCVRALPCISAPLFIRIVFGYFHMFVVQSWRYEAAIYVRCLTASFVLILCSCTEGHIVPSWYSIRNLSTCLFRIPYWTDFLFSNTTCIFFTRIFVAVILVQCALRYAFVAFSVVLLLVFSVRKTEALGDNW